MKKTVLILTPLVAIILVVSITLFFLKSTSPIANPTAKKLEKPLLEYSFENLKVKQISGGDIKLGRKLDETEDYVSQIFYFETPESPSASDKKIVSGMANIPKSPGSYPVIIMFRGFIPGENFITGAGSLPTARMLASNGFITLAPDFLGFGESDPAADSFQGRFETYTTALSLLESAGNLNSALNASYSAELSADTEKIGLWGHSNGGHIALSVLAISGKRYPTVLWAPVSKSFPYSILYYTDEYDDQGKIMRKTLASFEEIYDTYYFSPTNYYSWINAPLQIHQGEADIEVPVWWSDELVEVLSEKKIEVEYFTYPGANHNLLPGGWNTAVSRTVEFFENRLK